MNIEASLPGYARLKSDGARGLVMKTCKGSLETILEVETLYQYASRQEGARQFKGRTTAYGISLGDGCGDVVVRHSMRGGFLARTGTDLFLPPTRGLRELMNSLRLKLASVPTPEVVAFVAYRVGRVLRRSDVATREIPDSHDLAAVLRQMEAGPDRDKCLEAAGRLLSLLAHAGAHHPDLNARNVLVTWESNHGARAHILDVDRIRFHVPGDPMVANANMQRLERSLQKLSAIESLAVSARDIDVLRGAAAEVSQ